MKDSFLPCFFFFVQFGHTFSHNFMVSVKPIGTKRCFLSSVGGFQKSEQKNCFFHTALWQYLQWTDGQTHKIISEAKKKKFVTNVANDANRFVCTQRKRRKRRKKKDFKQCNLAACRPRTSEHYFAHVPFTIEANEFSCFCSRAY